MRIIDILPFFSWLERWCIGNEHGILGPLGPLTRSAAVACGACKSSAFETRISSEFFFYVCWSRESVCIPYFGLFRSLNIKILMMIDDDWWWYWMILDYNPWIFYSKPRANIFPGAKEIGFAVLIVVCCALLHLQRLLELPPGLHFWRFLALRIEPDGSWLKSTHRQTALTNLWAIHRLHHVPFT
jgi:hypothetical protein